MISIPQFTPKRGLSSFVRSLFANSEQGAWYDPSDMATLFQDRSGQTPVTAVEQPVSLMLDKRKGLVLGSELVTNGNFSGGTTGWTVNSGWSISSGTATYSRATGTTTLSQSGYSQNKFYVVEFDVVNTTGSQEVPVYVYFGDGITVQESVIYIISGKTGRYSGILFSSTYTSLIFRGSQSSGSFGATIDNISVKEVAGNHAYTPSTATASRPVLSARVNLLTKTEQFDDAAWNQSAPAASTIVANNTTAPNGTNTADKLQEKTGSVLPVIYYDTAISFTSGVSYKASCYIKSAGRNIISLYFQSAPFPDSGRSAWFNLSNQTTQVQSGVTASIVSVGNDWYLCSITATADATNSSSGNSIGILITAGMGNFDAYTGDGTSGIYIWGADLRVSNDGVGIPSYQRVNTSTDYDTVGFPMYLKFDGSDDYMLTNSVDFSGGDAICVGAAVRKTSDAALGVVLEHSATIASNNGTFLLSAPNSAAANFNFSSKGSTAVDNTVTTYTSPISAVIVADADISADTNNIRINGGSATAVTSDQGSGNYGNYAMYLGRRGGTASPFNGRLYGAIVRAGAVTDAQVGGITSFLNSKSKVY